MTTPPDVVLVEDDPADLAVALRAFRRARLDHRIVVLHDGDAALSYLLEGGEGPRGRPPAVVLLDLNLPRVDGFEVLRRLREDARTRRVPVVVVSSSPRETDVRRAYEAGANSYVVKRPDEPHPGELLVDVARYWIDLNAGPP